MEYPSDSRRIAPLKRLAAAVALTLAPICGAQAHPHMWINATVDFRFDEQGRLAALEEHWDFDEMFSSYALMGVTKQKGGGYADKTLQEMVGPWMEALGDPISHYFTRVSLMDRELPTVAPTEYSGRWVADSSQLGLTFTLPLVQPLALAPGQTLEVSIQDPTFFVAYDFTGENPVTGAPPPPSFKPFRLVNAPAGCGVRYVPPRELDWQTMARLAEIPEDADPESMPADLLEAAGQLQHRLLLTCG
ncbi:MAG: DUF1007 family protein [Corticimicrobacter sp.]|uniref:DUF1007 family protein n=1 Tax=Corticimicrobacter sp. TaxID=2678536 RepID=UPI0032DA182D